MQYIFVCQFHLWTVDQYHPQEACMHKIEKSYQTVFEKIFFRKSSKIPKF